MTSKADHKTPPMGIMTSIAVGVSAFLLVFQPFGLSLNSTEEILIILGFAPLNFTVMMLLHKVSFMPSIPGGITRVFIIVSANILYIQLMSQSALKFQTGLKVLAIAGLVMSALLVWRHQENLRAEILNLKRYASHPTIESVTLRGQGERDILKIKPDDLYFLKAQGNYVSVHYQSKEFSKDKLLRTTLGDIAAALPHRLLERCHRSYMVNLNPAEKISVRGGHMHVEFPDGQRVPVSRNYRDRIRSMVS